MSITDPPREENAHLQLSELTDFHVIAASCLDPDIYILAQLENVKMDNIITKSIANLVGSIDDIRATARIFFNTTHTWLPIISKKQFYDGLLERLALRKPEVFLLILSMKLLCSRVLVAKSMVYRTVKQLYIDMESSGRLSVLVLQAAILITFYELGHGIYPAAIMSVGNCARIGVLLGLDKYLTTYDRIAGVPWIEHEERRRIWWMIVLLDRYARVYIAVILRLSALVFSIPARG